MSGCGSVSKLDGPLKILGRVHECRRRPGRGLGVAGPCQVDERNRTGGGLNYHLVLRQCPSDDSQTHPVQHMTWAQFQKEFRSKALGLLGVRTKIKEWVVETIVIQPRHAPTIDRRAGSAAMGARRAVDRSHAEPNEAEQI